MAKTSAEFMLAKVDAAYANLEELGGQLAKARTQLQSLRYSLGLLQQEQSRTFAAPPLGLTDEGWSAVGPNGYRPSGNAFKLAPRHGCTWNTKESNDLRVGLSRDNLTVEELAKRHRRTVGSISSEIARWFEATKGE